MPKIKFTATPKLPADYRHLGYVKGMEIEGTKDWCDKWVVSRNVAVYVGGETVAKVVEPVAEPAEPVTVGVRVDADGKFQAYVEPEPVAVLETVAEPKAAPKFDTPRRGRPVR